MSTWVLLRGLMRESRHWGEFPQLFQQTVAAQRVVAPDFPGNGSLYLKPSADNVNDMVEFLRGHLREQNVAPPYNLLALSLGAMVAVAWSEHYPHELEKMVLINTSLAPCNPFYHRLRPANYPALFRQMLFGSSAQREKLVLKLTSNLASHSLRKQSIVESWINYALRYPVSRANILRQLRAAMGNRASDTAPAIPTLLLVAQQDKLVNAKCSLKLCESWHCDIRIHPTAGHDLPLDDGEWVAKQVKGWLMTSN